MIDLEEIEKRLLIRPETYRSLLKEDYGRNTKTIIVKRKMLRCIRKGSRFGAVKLSGTRGGQVLFYNLDKTYSIVISSEYMSFNYFYCEDCKYIDKATLKLIKPYRLKNNEWNEYGNGELDIFVGNIIKVV